MNILKKIPSTVYLLLIVVSLQTFASLLPGIILIEQKVAFSFGLFVFIIYLLWSQIFEYMMTHPDFVNHTFPLKVFSVKFAISMIMIITISNAFTYQYGLILLSYEVFHFLLFSDQFNYQESFLYFLMNALFKGIVFNLIISISYPYNFQLLYFQPYIFSTLMILTGSLLLKLIRQNQHTLKKSDFLYLVPTFIGTTLFLITKNIQKELNISLTIIMIGLFLIATLLAFYWKQKNNTLAQIVVIASVIINLALFYFN